MSRLILPRRALLKAGAAALITSPAIIGKAAAQLSGGLTFPGPGTPASAGGSTYSATAVSFTGSQHIDAASALTGAVDGPAGIVSFWFNMTGGDGSVQIVQESASGAKGILIYRLSGNTWQIQGHDSASAQTFLMTSSTAYSTITNPGWHHFLASWNASTGSTASFLYIDDVSVINTNTGGVVNTNYSVTSTNLFARTTSFQLQADVAEFYVNYATNLDLSVIANRRKFVSAAIHPVDLGIDGSTPTGTAPIIWFSANNTYAGQNVGTGGATWATNKGSGGALTKTGTLAAAATNP